LSAQFLKHEGLRCSWAVKIVLTFVPGILSQLRLPPEFIIWVNDTMLWLELADGRDSA